MPSRKSYKKPVKKDKYVDPEYSETSESESSESDYEPEPKSKKGKYVKPKYSESSESDSESDSDYSDSE